MCAYVCVLASILGTKIILLLPTFRPPVLIFLLYKFCIFIWFFFVFIFVFAHTHMCSLKLLLVFFFWFPPIRLSQPWLADFACWSLRWKAFEPARNLILKFSNYFLLKVNTVKIAIKKIGQLRCNGDGCGRGRGRVRVRVRSRGVMMWMAVVMCKLSAAGGHGGARMHIRSSQTMVI